VSALDFRREVIRNGSREDIRIPRYRFCSSAVRYFDNCVVSRVIAFRSYKRKVGLIINLLREFREVEKIKGKYIEVLRSRSSGIWGVY
jgi:hypothetical protein